VSEKKSDAELRSVNVRGLSIGYRQAGYGPPLVLLHGAFEDSRFWAPQLDDLSDEFTVIALDAPGFGASDDPPPTWMTADYGNHLGDILDALGVIQPTVVGLSFGSVYALALYRERPQAVGALVLASAYAGWAGSLSAEEVQRRVEQSEAEMTAPVDQIVGKWLPTLLTPTAPADILRLVSTMMQEFHPAGMRPALRALGAVDLRDVLETITVPTLLVYGEADVRSPADVVGEDMHARIAGSNLVVIAGAPHLVSLEQPEAFNAAIRQFIREHR
jgi:pimeloyl-ACP methyl ester carboxylesterase